MCRALYFSGVGSIFSLDQAITPIPGFPPPSVQEGHRQADHDHGGQHHGPGLGRASARHPGGPEKPWRAGQRPHVPGQSLREVLTLSALDQPGAHWASRVLHGLRGRRAGWLRRVLQPPAGSHHLLCELLLLRGVHQLRQVLRISHRVSGADAKSALHH